VEPLRNVKNPNFFPTQRSAQQVPNVVIRSLPFNGVSRRYLIVEPPLNFPYQLAALNDAHHPALDNLVGYLQRHPEVFRVEIQGFAGDYRDRMQNLSLSRGRAEFIRNYLISRGLEASRFTVHGYGEVESPSQWHIAFRVTGERPSR